MANKSIIYDGACTLCIRSKNTLITLGLADKDHTWAYQQLPDQYLGQVDYERFRNEMALIDLQGGETLYGPEAISYLLSDKSALFRLLFSIGPLYRVFSFCYKIIALNRTAIMVPRLKKVRCASCEPDTPPEFRWFWIGFATGTGVLFSMLMGIFGWNDVFKLSLFLGLLSLILVFFLWLKKHKDNYLEISAHASSLFLSGIALISIGILVMEIYGDNFPWPVWLGFFTLVSLILGRNYMLRTEFLRLSPQEKIVGAAFMVPVFLICYIALIF